MINSLCGSSVSLKSEKSSTKLQQPTSSNDSVLQSKKNGNQSSADNLEQTSLTPPSLNLPALKFDLDGDVQVQSPDSTSMWESFFSDQLDADFMISSPVRNIPNSPQASTYNCNYNYAHAMHGQSLSGCSPPRFSSQVGTFNSSSNKGKGLSPLHKVFNSPNNQYMQHVENLSLPAIEEFLEYYQEDGLGGGGGYSSSTNKVSSSDIGSSSDYFDMQNSIPSSNLDSLTIMQNSSRYYGSVVVSEESSVHGGAAGSSQLSQESDIYHQMGSMASASLSQALQQERHQEKQRRQQQLQLQHEQQQQSHPHLHSLMVPAPIGTEQVIKSFLLYFFLNL